jgi:hypothetical protein
MRFFQQKEIQVILIFIFDFLLITIKRGYIIPSVLNFQKYENKRKRKERKIYEICSLACKS